MELSRGLLVRRASGVTPDPKVRPATPSLSRRVHRGGWCWAALRVPAPLQALSPSTLPTWSPFPCLALLAGCHAQGQLGLLVPSGDPGPMGPPGRHGQRGPKGEKGEKGRDVCPPGEWGWAGGSPRHRPSSGELTQHVLGFCCLI